MDWEVVGAIGTLCGITFGYIGYKKGLKDEYKNTGTREGSLHSDISYIKSRTDDVLLEQKDTNRNMNLMNERLTRVEESTNQLIEDWMDLQGGINLKNKFIDSIKDGAIKSQRDHNILASLTLAQAIVESGWGRESIGNNIFGIKVGTNWKGKKQLVTTREFINNQWITIQAWFRNYDSISDCIEDRNKFLQYPRYTKVLASKDYKEACIEISKAGYATDPGYTKLLTDIIEQNKLYIFDKEVIKVSNLLKTGSSGNDVKNLQIKLKRLGLDVGSLDGLYGPATDRQVKELQSIFNLTADGIAGKNTFDLLDKLDQVKHFKLDEFRCKHCKKLKLDINLLLKLEELRKSTGPLIINSGYRCPVHNKNVGGASKSQHLQGTAADLRATGISPSQVHSHADKVFSTGGVGRYNSFTHVDTRNGRSRWNG